MKTGGNWMFVQAVARDPSRARGAVILNRSARTRGAVVFLLLHAASWLLYGVINPSTVKVFKVRLSAAPGHADGILCW